MTNKQLARELRDIGNSLFDKTYDPNYKLLLDEASDRLENQSKWISVDERLPEDVYGKDREQITVLVYTKGKKVSQCSRCAEYKLIEREPFDRNVFRRTGKFYWNKSKRVTHWMPLPEAPKMKGGE